MPLIKIIGLMVILSLWGGGGAVYGQAREQVASVGNCSDQWLLGLADDDQIAALSPESVQAFSYQHQRAKTLKQHDDSLEGLYQIKPDWVLHLGWGETLMVSRLKEMGMTVHSLPIPQSIDDMMTTLETIGRLLGQDQRATSYISKLSNLKKMTGQLGRQQTALYLSPSGISTGRQTYIGEVISLAGYQNYLDSEEELGWSQIDLEQLASDPPDLIVASFFDVQQGMADSWRLGQHPVIQSLKGKTRFVHVPANLLSCPTWQVLDAVSLINNQQYESLNKALRAADSRLKSQGGGR